MIVAPAGDTEVRDKSPDKPDDVPRVKVRDQSLDKSLEVDRVKGLIDTSAGKCSLKFDFAGGQTAQLRGELEIAGDEAKVLQFDLRAPHSLQMRFNQQRWAPPSVTPLPKWLLKGIANILQEQSSIEALDMIEEHSSMSIESRKDLSMHLNTIVSRQLERIESLRQRVHRNGNGVDFVRKMLNSGAFAQVWIGLMLAQTLRISLQKELTEIYLRPPENLERLERLAYRLLLPEVRREVEVERRREP
jgi:hypothetical protein